MIVATVHFVSQTQQAGQAVVITSWVELLTISTILGIAVTVYRNSRCHATDCRREWRGHRLTLRRRGKYPHGHYKLCHVHHPNVPSDGKITAAHVQHLTHDGQ